MMYIKWAILVPLNLLAMLSAFLLAPIWALFADKEGKYPRLLYWASTPDNTADGDGGFKENHAKYKGDPALLTWGQRYINRIWWMMRNPAYGFDYMIAFKAVEGCKVERIAGTHDIDGRKDQSGYYLAVATNPDGSKAWQFYMTHHWNATHCWKCNLGYKVWATPIESRPCQFTFSPLGVYWPL